MEQKRELEEQKRDKVIIRKRERGGQRSVTNSTPFLFPYTYLFPLLNLYP